MQRDLELIRTILLELERAPTPNQDELRLPDVSEEQIGYHVKLLHQAGFVEAIDISTREEPMAWLPLGLTWAGHEFLDAARNQTTWRRALQNVQGTAGSVPISVLQALLISFGKAALGLP